jgi:surface protein
MRGLEMKKMQKKVLFMTGVLISVFLFNSIAQLISFQDQEKITGDPLKEWREKAKAAVDPDAFISIWDTTLLSTWSSASNQVKLPLEEGGTYDFTVAWGDGTSDTITSWDQGEVTHTYNSSGFYTINITGTIHEWRFNNRGDLLKIVEIQQWGTLRLGNAGSYFYGCENLHLTTTDTLDLTGTTTLSQAFKRCFNIGSSGNLNAWDVSSVTDMSGMFYVATVFNQPLDSWDVSSVTDMGGMFYGVDSFDQSLEAWDVSSVTDMSEMFYGVDSFDQSLEAWDVSSVTDMASMFRIALLFNQPLASWNVSRVTDMRSMFSMASSFNQLLDAWDVSSVTDMYSMFSGASVFNQPLDSWDVSSVKDITEMFLYAEDFNQPLNTWDVSSVTDMSEMFYWAVSFDQSLEAWDVSSVTDMANMFRVARLINQPLASWNVSRVTDMGGMFSGARSFNQPLSAWNVSRVTDMGEMFSIASSFNQPLDSWDVSSVTDMNRLFKDASSFNRPLDSWDVSSVTDMSWMFKDASSFNRPLDSWNISSVSDMKDMFGGVILSTINYDGMLVSWSQLPLQSGVVFDAGNSQYSDGPAATARQLLIDTYDWTITDGGQVPDAPNAPVLNTIEGPSSSGNIILAWNPVEGATTYRIYRSTSPITDVSGLTAIITGLTDTTYQDTVLSNNTYYYVVIATNAGGDSPISNCESVVVALVSETTTETTTTTSTSTTDSTTDTDTDGIAGFPPAWFGIIMLGSLIGLMGSLRTRRR